MTPRTRAVVALVGLCLLPRCGQPYSNEDLAFLAALPEREQLEARIPQEAGGTARAGLTDGRSAQDVGDVSPWPGTTRAQGDAFNAFLGFLLGRLDAVRMVPATTREEERRIWGPYPWEGQRQFEGRLVITRAGEGTFTWDIQFRLRDVPGAPWHDFLKGEAQTGGELRSSRGTVRLPVRAVREAGLAVGEDANGDGRNDLEGLAELRIDYDATVDPVQVTMGFEAVTGDAVSLSSRRAADGSGTFVYGLRLELVAGTHPQENARITARWQPDGRGRADLLILEGDGAGAGAVECWGADFLVTYQAQLWPGGAQVGDAGSCIPAG